MATSAPGLPDAESLLAGARAGNRRDLGDLLERYRPYLLALAQRMLAQQLPGENSSVVQDGILAAVDHLHQFKGATCGEFLGWLSAIVRHEALNRLRREKRMEPLPADSRHAPLESQSSPSQQVTRREDAARVRQAVDRLPERSRQVIEMRNFQNRSFTEIAHELSLTDAHVRQLWVRAVRELRDTMESSDGRQA
jgi:RNA polymerase sigma-70 factor (ECF subfamily)